jgi:hypothetical protein
MPQEPAFKITVTLTQVDLTRIDELKGTFPGATTSNLVRACFRAGSSSPEGIRRFLTPRRTEGNIRDPEAAQEVLERYEDAEINQQRRA